MTSSSQTLKVGVIGVGSKNSWAREAHVAAVLAVPGLELLSVATRDPDTARATANELGAQRGYGDARELIRDADVDIVTVGVPVPAHRDLILAALDAGKHVVTEWPVGTSTQQTEQLADAAARTDSHTAVDLQARLNPAAVRARQLIGSGAIGRVLTVTGYSSTAGFGPTTTEQSLYLEDPAVGMNLTTIQTAHTIDFAVHLAGSMTGVAALRTVRYPDLTISDARNGRPDTARRTVPDHVVLHGRLATGGALALQVVGGLPPEDAPFHLDIVGETGTLTLDGGGARGFQAGVLQLLHDGDPVAIVDDLGRDLPESIVNVAHVYAALRDDIVTGRSSAPSFDDAVRLAHLIDDLIASDEQHRTVSPNAPWPGLAAANPST